MENLWKQFAGICAIPHPSGHLDAIREHIKSVAKLNGLMPEVDEIGNVLVRIPATPGKENVDGVILEAHMDMVPQCNSDKKHDFTKDPIKTHLVKKGENAEYPDAELVMAEGTTLGADNGIGCASMLTLMGDKSVAHGPVECLFTVDEETGMSGVNNLREGWLKGKYLFNLDTEAEGELMIGCAGGVNMDAFFKYKKDEKIPEGDVAIQLKLSGLLGGHSGMDIHLGRGNAIKLMVRFLKHAIVNFEIRIGEIHGGSLRNAIPRECYAIVTVPSEVADELFEEVAYYDELYRFELRGIDEGIKFEAKIAEMPKALVPEDVVDDIINSVEACFDGVFRMSPDMPEVVETSSNLALLDCNAEEAHAVLLVRSMNEEMKRYLASTIQSVFILGGAKVEFSAPYPGWELSQESPLLAKALAVYRETFGKDMKVNSVHCGLECGIIGAHYPELDIISFGPTIHHPHSPQESVETESVEKFWKYLVELLKAV